MHIKNQKLHHIPVALSFILLVVVSSAVYGQTWKRVYGPSGEDIEGLLADPAGRIFAGTDTGSWTTSNYGASWARDSGGMTAPDQFAYVEMPSGLLFAGTEVGGIFRSSDFGIHWVRANNGISDSATVPGLVCTSGGALLAAVSGKGMYVSNDLGDQWQPSNEGLQNPAVWSLMRAPNGDIYAGLTGAIARSTDQGVHWTTVFILDALDEAMSLATDSSGRIYAGTFHARVLTSSNGGTSWIDVGPSQPAAVRCLSTAGEMIFAGTYGSGIYRSVDNGQHWNSMNDGLLGNDLKILSSVVTPNGYLFIGTLSATIFRTVQPLSSVVNTDERKPAAVSVRYDESHRLEISLHLVKSENISLTLVDAAGREISSIYNDFEGTGEHTFTIDLPSLPKCAAFVVFRAPDGNFATPVEF